MRALILCISALLLQLLPAWGAEILLLQANRSSGYQEAVRGFHSVAKRSVNTVVLSDYAEIDVERIVKEERPRIVVAVGDKALASVKRLRETPVVSVLSLSHCRKKAADNVGGIAMLAAPELYLRLFVSMGVKKVGVLYDPDRLGPYVKRAEQDARELGVTLVAEPVNDPRDMQAKLDKMKRNIDLLWMLPESSIFTSVNIEAFMLFSVANKLPVATFSSHYLKNGAAAALDLDYYDVGLQAGELTLSLLNTPQRKVPTLDPRKSVLQINESVIRKLDLNSPEK
jgi:putative tryptophan/tyrosine transport system substrate-binding protein